ncbi:A kinase (PRKA) anchor inhibitor 1 [Cricetulus griseus]
MRSRKPGNRGEGQRNASPQDFDLKLCPDCRRGSYCGAAGSCCVFWGPVAKDLGPLAAVRGYKLAKSQIYLRVMTKVRIRSLSNFRSQKQDLNVVQILVSSCSRVMGGSRIRYYSLNLVFGTMGILLGRKRHSTIVGNTVVTDADACRANSSSPLLTLKGKGFHSEFASDSENIWETGCQEQSVFEVGPFLSQKEEDDSLSSSLQLLKTLTKHLSVESGYSICSRTNGVLAAARILKSIKKPLSSYSKVNVHDPGQSGSEDSERLSHSEKPGNEPEEAKLQNASKQIVQNAILRAVQQVSQESLQRGGRPSDCRPRGRLGGCELTKKHEKK